MKENNILILVNERKDINFNITKSLIEYFKEKDKVIFVEENLVNNLGCVKPYNGEDVFLTIVIGGDGTMLSYVQKYKEHNFNYFGINAGRVGCICEGTTHNYKDKLNLIFEGSYYVEKRNSLKCILDYKDKEKVEATSFNEITLSRGNFPKLLNINLNINNIHNTPFFADGVLVATTTGSTAYNLSCNGPLLLPDSKNFVITPINSQSRLITSLVVNEEDKIGINLVKMKIDQTNEASKPVVFIDGNKRYEIDENCTIILSKSPYYFNMIRTDKNSSLYEPVKKVSQSSIKA